MMGITADRIEETLEEMRDTLRSLGEEQPPPGGTWDLGDPTEEDPLRDDEGEALKADAKVMLRELLADHLAAHLAKEYAGRPEEISVPRVSEYMGQVTVAINEVLSDATWLDELMRTAIYRARKLA